MQGMVEYVQMLREQSKNIPSTLTHEPEPQPLAEYGLDGVDCPICHNTGTLVRKDENDCVWARKCSCMAERVSLRDISKSGLSDSMKRHTFDAYKTPDSKTAAVKEKAKQYCKDTSGKWFFIAGESGSGKTHLCTSICGELFKQSDVRYMLWRDESVRLKASVTDRDAYTALIEPLKNVSVLYIDDFLKGKIGEADINLAFEIINARYLDSRKRTIISTERPLKDIIALDHALGSRIYERSRGYVVAAPTENWRMREK